MFTLRLFLISAEPYKDQVPQDFLARFHFVHFKQYFGQVNEEKKVRFIFLTWKFNNFFYRLAVVKNGLNIIENEKLHRNEGFIEKLLRETHSQTYLHPTPLKIP